MAKVFGPLMALSASGSLGKTLTYVCGLYVRRAKRDKPFEYTEARSEQQSKWSEGCVVWQSLGDDKALWNDFVELVSKGGLCAVQYSQYATGFQTFISYYLLEGPDGWINYPLPPL